MKIYTKTGDKGETSLYGGKRVLKNDLQIESYGNTDELNSWIGLIKSYSSTENWHGVLRKIQVNLFNIGAHLAADLNKPSLKLPILPLEDLEELELSIDKIDEQLEPLTHFILPGGEREIAEIQIARTVCRRAERSIIAYFQQTPPNDYIIQYVNRLSDFLFILARHVAKKQNINEDKWLPEKE